MESGLLPPRQALPACPLSPPQLSSDPAESLRIDIAGKLWGASTVGQKERGFGIQHTCIFISPLPFLNCATLGQWLQLSGTQFLLL